MRSSLAVFSIRRTYSRASSSAKCSRSAVTAASAAESLAEFDSGSTSPNAKRAFATAIGPMDCVCGARRCSFLQRTYPSGIRSVRYKSFGYSGGLILHRVFLFFTKGIKGTEVQSLSLQQILRREDGRKSKRQFRK